MLISILKTCQHTIMYTTVISEGVRCELHYAFKSHDFVIYNVAAFIKKGLRVLVLAMLYGSNIGVVV